MPRDSKQHKKDIAARRAQEKRTKEKLLQERERLNRECLNTVSSQKVADVRLEKK